MKRSTEERLADLEARAQKLRADSDRRLSVASNSTCSLMWDAECALRKLAAYMGTDGADHSAAADSLKAQREAEWKKVRDARG